VGSADFGIKTVALLCCIAEGKAIYHYKLFYRSVNGDQFIEFLDELKDVHGDQKLVLYLDHLRVHKRKDVLEKYKELDIQPVFTIRYAPEYNPQEYIFSKLKGLVRKMRL
jgi:transposase